MDDTAVGIISPAATYPSVPALGFFVDGTKCDSLATNQRSGTDRYSQSVVDAQQPTLPRSGPRFPAKSPGKAVSREPENKCVSRYPRTQTFGCLMAGRANRAAASLDRDGGGPGP
jgi:hypothetical protein